MAKGFRAEIKGDKELIKKFYRMGKDMAGVVLETAAQAGADIVSNEANRLAPGPNIKTELEKKTSKLASIDIGPDEDHWYYRFFETGAQPHEITPSTKGGLQFAGREGEMIVRVFAAHPGMAARPFLRPAHETQKGRAEEATGQEFILVINKHVERR